MTRGWGTNLRQSFGFALIGLGFLAPLGYILYLMLCFRTEPASFMGLLFLYAFQWSPFMALSWFAASFFLKDWWWCIAVGVLSALTTLVSLWSYLLVLRLSI